MLLYVYGTLRQGGMLSHYMADAEYLSVEKVSGYKMVDVGAYPAALPCNGSIIVCEKYKVNENLIETLDIVEGVPSLYERVEIDGVYMYVMHPWNAGGLKTIESGDWMEYLKKRNK